MSRASWRAWLALGACVAALCSIRALLHHAVEQRVVAALARNERYAGSYRDVDISVLRLSYSIEGLELVRRTGRIPVPFVTAERVDYALDATQLVRGRVRGSIAISRPVLNLVDGPTPALRQGPTGVDWRIVMRRLFPTNLNRIEIRDGALHFRNFHTEPEVDVRLDRLQIEATNLAWRGAAARGVAFHLRGSGAAMESGSIDGEVSLYRDTREPSFDCRLRIAGARLPEWNSLLQAYLGIDVESGSARVDVDLRARDGALQGSVTPAIADLRALDLPGELLRQSALDSVAESLIDLAVFLLRDPERHVIETRIPVSGTIRDPRRDDWESARQLVHQAFVAGLESLGEAL